MLVEVGCLDRREERISLNSVNVMFYYAITVEWRHVSCMVL